IELLVVISIIALLIGILLPALGAARKAARNAECLSRMHQCAVALNSYPADYKGTLPPAFGGPSGDPLFGGGVGDGLYFTDYFEEYMEVSDDLNTDFYMCPESTLTPAPDQKKLSYSCNSSVLVNRTTALGNKISDVRRPSEVVAMGDASQLAGVGVSGPNYSGPFMGPFTNPATANTPLAQTEATNADGLPYYAFRLRHQTNLSGNAAYVDGHA
ncbi:unnamed protein product, partial [Ectocarpus sp. 4 AP-2014]